MTYRDLSAPSRSHAEQISASVGMTTGHPQNDGRIRYRKREIENTRFSHAVRRQAPYPTKRTSPQPTCFMIHPPCRGSSTVALSQSRMNPLLERCCMGVVNQIIDLDNSSKPLPYKSADAFICRGGACSSRNVCQDDVIMRSRSLLP